MDLRCTGGKLHGVLVEESKLIEFKCRSARCGASSRIIVMHYFDPNTGELVKTSKFSEPAKVFNRTS